MTCEKIPTNVAGFGEQPFQQYAHPPEFDDSFGLEEGGMGRLTHAISMMNKTKQCWVSCWVLCRSTMASAPDLSIIAQVMSPTIGGAVPLQLKHYNKESYNMCCSIGVVYCYSMVCTYHHQYLVSGQRNLCVVGFYAEALLVQVTRRQQLRQKLSPLFLWRVHRFLGEGCNQLPNRSDVLMLTACHGHGIFAQQSALVLYFYHKIANI